MIAPGVPAGPAPPGHTRALVQPVAAGLLIVLTFVGTYLLLLLAPTVHDLPVAVAGPGDRVEGLQAAVPHGAVRLVAVPDAAAAEAAVLDRSVVGAYLPDTATVLVAGAGGAATAQAVTAVGTGLAGGDEVTVRDLAPLPATDPRGLGGFYLVFGMVLAAFIFGQTNHLYSRGLPLRLRLAQTAVISPGAGLLGALIAGPPVGATTAPFGTVAVVLTLLVAAVALFTQAVTSLLGDPGILVSTLLLLTLGNAAGGGAVPVPFLPDGLRQAAGFLPPGAAVRLLQDAAAFPRSGLAAPTLVLLAWCVAGLAGLGAAYRRAPGHGPILVRTLT